MLPQLQVPLQASKLNKKLVSFDQFNDIVELPKFRKLERKYSTSE